MKTEGERFKEHEKMILRHLRVWDVVPPFGYDEYPPVGTETVACVPFGACGDTMTIHVSNDYLPYTRWYCVDEDLGGDVIALVQVMYSLDRQEAVEYLMKEHFAEFLRAD